ncbi:MAG: hypothetical protein M3463_00530 [Verrucomicrobiota bacterium]|nr:hypothetical protein [Verrucomicrobiota bacterium]
MRPYPREPVASAFTLIELLAVIAVMLVMTGLLAAAFTGIGKGSALTAAGNNVSNLALLARQNSLAKNAMTALLILGSSGTAEDYRALALYEIVPHADGTPVRAADWTQLGRWETLPSGVVVDDCTFAPSSTAMTPPLATLTYKGSPVASYQYVVFLPSGSLLRVEPARVRLVQGFREPGRETVSYTGARAANGEPANYYDISIISANGRVKVDRP